MNSKRGGVTLKADDAEYVVRISTNAMVRYQDYTANLAVEFPALYPEDGESFLDGIAALQKKQSDVRRMRNLFWAGVSHIEDMTPDQAGEIMDDVGFAEALEAVSEAAALAFPSDEDAEKGNAPAGKPAKKAT